MTKNKITNPIEEYRVLNKYSQEDFGKLLDMNRNTYRSRIKGETLWTAPEITKLLKITGKHYSELFL